MGGRLKKGKQECCDGPHNAGREGGVTCKGLSF